MFTDPQLAALYDAVSLHEYDTPFHVELTAELAPVDVVDICLLPPLQSGRLVREDSVLAFRTHEQVLASLSDAGLEVENVYGDWDRSPVSAQGPELIFVVRRGA